MNIESFNGVRRQIPAESIVFEEGDPSDFMYIIASGRVVIFKKVVQSATRVLHNIGDGEYFGEMSLITGAKRSASAKTISETEVIQIDKNGLLKLLKEDPAFGINLMRQMAERLEQTSESLIYSELELALASHKPERFNDAYDGKTIFIATGYFSLENKKEVMQIAGSIKWPDDIDLITSLYKPEKVENELIYVAAVYDLKSLLNVTLRFESLVQWDFSPAFATSADLFSSL